MTRTHAAHLNRALCNIRASPQIERCRHQAPHLIEANADHPLRDESHTVVVRTAPAGRDEHKPTDGHLLLPVQSAPVHFHFLSLRVILVRRF
jgi:hypothetical protein